MESKIRFSIIIVSYRVRDFLEKCVESIIGQKCGDAEIIVVDNNSRDGSSGIFLRFPNIKFIELEENMGFARANNIGAREARGEYLVFLNPDTLAPADFLKNLESFTKSNPEICFFGGKVKNPDGSLQPSVRRYPRLSDQLFRSFKLHHIFPKAGVWRKYIADDFNYDKQALVQQIMGAFMVVRSQIFFKLGCFRENFFLWFEEVDLCRRAAETGIGVWYTPVVEITHYGGRSFLKLGPKKQLLFSVSLSRYFFYHKNYFSSLVIILVLPISLCLTYLGRSLLKR